MYVKIHQEAYQDLWQHNEIIPEDKRVRVLLTGIKDQSLNAAKQTIMAIQDLRTNFVAAMAHIATTLQMNVAITPDNRNVSDVNTGRGGRGNNFNRGRGRGGHGRDNRGGRG
jgi:hypothetical protein